MKKANISIAIPANLWLLNISLLEKKLRNLCDHPGKDPWR
jgi:hypothetical protein